MRFQSLLLNHTWAVVDNNTKAVVDEFRTPDAANRDADARNLDAWRQTRPDSVTSFEGGVTFEDLAEIIDRIYEPEEKLELLSVGLRRVA